MFSFIPLTSLGGLVIIDVRSESGYGSLGGVLIRSETSLFGVSLGIASMKGLPNLRATLDKGRSGLDQG